MESSYFGEYKLTSGLPDEYYQYQELVKQKLYNNNMDQQI